MAQSAVCIQGGTSYDVVGVCAAKGGPAAALHSGNVGGQHDEAEVVVEACLDLSALELICP
jgi:hypothetical protein